MHIPDIDEIKIFISSRLRKEQRGIYAHVTVAKWYVVTKTHRIFDIIIKEQLVVWSGVKRAF